MTHNEDIDISLNIKPQLVEILKNVDTEWLQKDNRFDGVVKTILD